MKTIEEYAIELVADGAEEAAGDDTNEAELIAADDHEEACGVALDMAKAIRDNPQSFAEWCKAIWNPADEARAALERGDGDDLDDKD